MRNLGIGPQCGKEVSAPVQNVRRATRLGVMLAGAMPLVFGSSVWAQAGQPGQAGQNAPGQQGQAGQPPTSDPLGKPATLANPPQTRETKTPPPPTAVSPNALPPQLTLSQAIEYGLRLQPNIAAAVAGREAADERRRAQYARFYPSITPTYQFVYQYVYGTVNQFAQSSSGAATVVPVQQGRTTDNRQAELGLSFLLFDSGGRELNARQTRQLARAAAFGESQARLNVIGNVADFYFSALRTQALVRVAQAQVARAQNTLDVVTAQVEAKVAARKDTYQAAADLLNAQVQLYQARNNAAIAQANLKQAIGVVGGETLQLADVLPPEENTPITALPEPPPPGTPGGNGPQPTPSGAGVTPPATAPTAPSTSTVPTTVSGLNAGEDADLINRYAVVAYRTRPDIAQQRQNVEVQQTQSTLSRIASGAQFTANVSAADQFDARQFDGSIGNNRQISIAASYPLFDGGLLRANQRAARATVRQSEATLAVLRLQIAVEVEQAYRTLAQSRAALPAVRAAQAAAQINYDAAIESRREGVGSIVEVIQAQTTLVQAQTNYVQAIYDFYSADARLTRAVGQGDRVPAIGGTAPANPSPVPIADPTIPSNGVVPPVGVPLPGAAPVNP